MRIQINQFAGEVEALSARLLQSQYATSAVNCRVDRNLLEPLGGLLAAGSLPAAGDVIFYYAGSLWLVFSGDVDIARSPIAYDTTDRIIWTGDGSLVKQARNDMIGASGAAPNWYYLGVPAPAYTPTIGSLGAPDPEQEGLEQTVYYVYTYVTAWGEESPPSEPSGGVDITDGQSVTLGNLLSMASASGYNFGAGALKRIYRSNSGTSATEFQFLAEIPYTATSYVDTIPAAGLGEVLPSVDWDPPPPGLKGVRTLPSGSLVGFVGNSLVYSEPYLPHAWSNVYPLKDDIVAIEVTSTGVLAATVDKPVSAVGLDPESISIQELDVRQACVSKRSMVDMGEYAIYASPDGLVGLENGSARLLTKNLFTRKQWQRFNPSTIKAYRWEDKYVAFYTGGGFIFSPNDTWGTFVELAAVSAAAGFYKADEDALYVAVGSALNKFGVGAPLEYTWASKLFQLPRPATFSCIQVIADTYPVTVDVIKDGVATTYSITSDVPQRLSSAAPERAHNWQVKFTGSRVVHEITLAQSMEEIADG